MFCKAALFTLILVFFGSTAYSQEHCVKISSDIARLECFDNAFKRTSPEVLTVEEATKAFLQSSQMALYQPYKHITLEKAQIDGRRGKRWHKYAITLDGCKLGVHSFRAYDFYKVNRTFYVEALAHALDLEKVKSAKVGFNKKDYIEISMERGESISVSWYRGQASSDILPRTWEELMQIFEGQRSFERTESIWLVREKEDSQEALSAFKELISACKSR